MPCLVPEAVHRDSLCFQGMVWEEVVPLGPALSGLEQGQQHTSSLPAGKYSPSHKKNVVLFTIKGQQRLSLTLLVF